MATASFKVSDLLGTTPAKVQTELLASTEYEVGMITGFAAGKTRGICAASILHGVRNPGAKVLVGRRTYAETVNTVKQPWFDMAKPLADAGWFVKPLKWDFREGTNFARLKNGSQFQFSNLDNPIKFRNEEYSLIVVDQAEEITEEMWELLLGRIRWAKVSPENWQAIAAANDEGHNWVWKRFVHNWEKQAGDPARCLVHPYCVFKDKHVDDDGNSRSIPCSTRRFFHGTTLDNQHNLSPRYLSVLLSKPEPWKRRFIYATMEGGSGRLLPDLRAIPHFEPPARWPKWRAIDHALNSPACCLWIAVNTDSHEHNGVPPNSPYVYREYWQDDSSVDQHCSRILAASRGETYISTVIDHSVFRRDQNREYGGRISIGDLYAEYGLYCAASVGDPFARVERIIGAHHGGMVVSERCVHLLATAPEYYAEQRDTDGTFAIKNRSEFHAIDALGYGLMFIPVDSRADATPADNSAYGDRSRDPSSDAVTVVHNRREHLRIQQYQESNERALAPTAIGSISADAFWGDGDSPDGLTVGKEYDPFYGGMDR